MEAQNLGGVDRPWPAPGRWISVSRLSLKQQCNCLVFLIFCGLAIPVATRLTGFAIRSTFRQQIMPNEGWNAYYARAAAAGVPLYGAKPDRLALNYPPLSYHLVGMLGRALGDMNFAGRVLSLLSLIWVGLCVGYIARKVSDNGWAGAFAALFWIGWVAIFAPTYVGTNDPQMLGHALILTAAAIYVSRPESPALLACACILCCAGGFVKHNLLAFPMAISMDLLLRSRRRFAVWVATASITLAIFSALTVWVDGPYLLRHLLNPRQYSLSRASYISGIFYHIFLPALAICAIRSVRGIRQSQVRFPVFAFLIAVVAGGFSSGGSGVNVNVFFEGLIAMSVIAALVLTELTNSVGVGTVKWFAAIALVPPLLSVAPMLMSGYASEPPGRSELADEERIFNGDVAYLKGAPGPAICFNMLLCYDAGKPLSYDPFITGERIATGRLDPRGIVADITAGRYAAIQAERDLFFQNEELVVAVKSRYRVEPRSGPRVFYVLK